MTKKNHFSPVFIVGNSRSGTTMLGRVLGKHSQIKTFRELHFFEQKISAKAVSQRLEQSKEKNIELLERLLTSTRSSAGLFCPVAEGQYREDAEAILAAAKPDTVSIYTEFLAHETKRLNKKIPCEQTPRYLFSANEILQAFPNCCVINLVRDPRDVLLSQKNKWRRRFLGAKTIPLYEVLRAWVNYHPYTISRLWVSAVRTAHALESHERFMTLKFEDILNAPKEEIEKLCVFINIPFEEDMLNVPQVGSSSGSDTPDKKGIDSHRTSSWRKGGLSRVELNICQRVSAKDMARLQYKVENSPVWFTLRWISMLLFCVKISMALMLNIRRSKNIMQSIRRRLFA